MNESDPQDDAVEYGTDGAIAQVEHGLSKCELILCSYLVCAIHLWISERWRDSITGGNSPGGIPEHIRNECDTDSTRTQRHTSSARKEQGWEWLGIWMITESRRGRMKTESERSWWRMRMITWQEWWRRREEGASCGKRQQQQRVSLSPTLFLDLHSAAVCVPIIAI